MLHVMSHVFACLSGGFLEKKEYYTSLLERQGGTLQPLPCCKCATWVTCLFEVFLLLIFQTLLNCISVSM